ncbi:hypothetical protein E2320_008107 [Naja naja]|nr:hypothetical protein E2320_008107 [Naja naja]
MLLGGGHKRKGRPLVCIWLLSKWQRCNVVSKSLMICCLINWFAELLLAKGDLTLKMAIEEAQTSEMSNLSAAEIQGVTSSPVAKPNATLLDYGEDINHLTNHQQLSQQRGWNPGNKPQQFPTVQIICLSCGGNHLRPACRFSNAICLNCQHKGHIARVCKSGKKSHNRRLSRQLGARNKEMNVLLLPEHLPLNL